MLKKTFITLVSTSILVFSISILKIDNPNNIKINEEIIKLFRVNNNTFEETTDNILGYIIIDKLHINRPLYNIDNNKNNIEENIIILNGSIMPTDNNSIMFIAAHSGTGYNAFFRNLDKLKENDVVKLIYNNEEYTYIVKNSWEEEKNGYINISKDESKQLILTTCSPNKDNYQLIVNCILKS